MPCDVHRVPQIFTDILQRDHRVLKSARGAVGHVGIAFFLRFIQELLDGRNNVFGLDAVERDPILLLEQWIRGGSGVHCGRACE